jgi:hypothetical protein
MHSEATAERRTMTRIAEETRRNRARGDAETGMTGSFVPLGTQAGKSPRTGLLTCAWFSYLPKDSTLRIRVSSGLLGSFADGKVTLAEILLARQPDTTGPR